MAKIKVISIIVGVAIGLSGYAENVRAQILSPDDTIWNNAIRVCVALTQQYRDPEFDAFMEGDRINFLGDSRAVFYFRHCMINHGKMTGDPVFMHN